LKILVVTPYDLSIAGGVTSHVNQVVKQLRRMGHDALLLGPASRPLKPDRYTVTIGGTIRFFSPGDAASINLNPFMIRRVRDFLSDRDFDVFHLHEPFVPFLGPAFLRVAKGVKVGTYHAWRIGQHWAYLVSIPLIRYWDSRLDGRVAVSEWSRQTISRYVPGKYEIIPNGIEFARFATPSAQPAKFRDTDPTILYVGRLEPRKGVEYLIKAFTTVKAQMPKARLVIVGDGGLMGECQRLVRRLKLQDVFFEGHVPGQQLPGYFQRADLVCVPSTGNESFGIVIAEAMASGLPIVASDCSSMSEMVESGQGGFLCAPDDVADFAAKINLLAADPALRRQMGAFNRARAETLFRRERMFAEYRALFEEVLSSRR